MRVLLRMQVYQRQQLIRLQKRRVGGYDLLELDDGLKPYYFYYYGPGIVLPATVSGLARQNDKGKTEHRGGELANG